MTSPRSQEQILYVFNLVTDLESPVLAAAHDWVVALSKNFEFVKVYSTHLGKVDLPKNVQVTELGGGGLKGKIGNLAGLALAFVHVIKDRKKASVFHHMSSRTLAILGFPIRCLNVPQGIWYSHSYADKSLKIGRFFTDYIFTSTPSSFPLNSKKTMYVGHGIKVPNNDLTVLNYERREGIVSLGRVARIKNLETLIDAVGKFNLTAKRPQSITFIGPVPDQEYEEELINLATVESVQVKFLGPIKHTEVLKTLRKFSYIYSGTPHSVDKALLEGALAGCLVLSRNQDAQILSGMSEAAGIIPGIHLLAIPEQLRSLEQLPSETRDFMREELSEKCEQNNNLDQTAAKIASTLIHSRKSKNAR